MSPQNMALIQGRSITIMSQDHIAGVFRGCPKVSKGRSLLGSP
jgi:hypothetical protein